MGFDKYLVEKFDDIKILRYEVKAFENLPLQEKLFVYYLSQAALAGRDILWDQNNRYNLRIRALLEKIILEYQGERNNKEFEAFLLYAKKVFFANGIHHHYSMDKFIPDFSCEYFRQLVKAVGENSEEVERAMFDPNYMKKRVVLDEGKDLIRESANNFYQGVTQKEVEEFYKNISKEEECPVSVGLNSTLVKENGCLIEKVWKIGGKYDKEIRKIVSYLRQALP
ncbi:MAG: dihydrofolate reductase, partial [Odoribacter sp.]|nr:dihydrofolate reductase [Odoribacter sp.]